MTPAERLQELAALYERAERLGDDVGARLKAGARPDELVPLLREQAGAVSRLQEGLKAFALEGTPEERARVRGGFERLRVSFRSLAASTEENHRLATRKGVRLTGIGGKPYTPRPGR